MSKPCHYDIAVIGAGAAGLVVAAVASQLGKKVVLIENNKMGGDCLNYGCIPSKSLLAAAKAAQNVLSAKHFGIDATISTIDFRRVMQHINDVIETISEHDSVERFTKLGVRVINAKASFVDKKTIRAGDIVIQANRFIIATGSSPTIPPITGLRDVPYLTNETIFSLERKPEHLIVIGAGPIGCEIAQSFCYLGTKVTMVEVANMMPRDEPELVHLLRAKLLRDGINIHEQTQIKELKWIDDKVTAILEKEGGEFSIEGSHLLLATGRSPNIADLKLDNANIKHTERSITVNASLRTSNRKVYAIGDAIGQYQFTHIASYQAGIVIKNMLFKIPAKVDYRAIPWVTYTSPELAHTGLLAKDALKHYPDSKVIECPLDTIDRAHADNELTGKIKVTALPNGRILGASILAPCAGELIVPWTMLIQQEKTLRDLTEIIIAYPTYSELSKKVASEFYKNQLYSSKAKWLVKLLTVFG